LVTLDVREGHQRFLFKLSNLYDRARLNSAAL